MDLRKKQTEDEQRVYMVSKLALKATPSDRIIELARPKMLSPDSKNRNDISILLMNVQDKKTRRVSSCFPQKVIMKEENKTKMLNKTSTENKIIKAASWNKDSSDPCYTKNGRIKKDANENIKTSLNNRLKSTPDVRQTKPTALVIKRKRHKLSFVGDIELREKRENNDIKEKYPEWFMVNSELTDSSEFSSSLETNFNTSAITGTTSNSPDSSFEEYESLSTIEKEEPELEDEIKKREYLFSKTLHVVSPLLATFKRSDISKEVKTEKQILPGREERNNGTSGCKESGKDTKEIIEMYNFSDENIPITQPDHLPFGVASSTKNEFDEEKQNRRNDIDDRKAQEKMNETSMSELSNTENVIVTESDTKGLLSLSAEYNVTSKPTEKSFLNFEEEELMQIEGELTVGRKSQLKRRHSILPGHRPMLKSVQSFASRELVIIEDRDEADHSQDAEYSMPDYKVKYAENNLSDHRNSNQKEYSIDKKLSYLTIPPLTLPENS